MGKQQAIQAEGRTLSGKNATRLKSAWVEIGAVLIEAGVVDSKVLDALEEQSGEDMDEDDAATPMMASNAPPGVTVVASGFMGAVRSRIWTSTLRRTLQLFGDAYERAYCDSDKNLRYHGKPESLSREEWQQQVLADLRMLLQEYVADRPDLMDLREVGLYAAARSNQSVQAGAFADEVRSRTWHQRVEITLQSFFYSFTALCGSTPEILEREGIEDVDAAIAQLIADLFTMLDEIGRMAPAPIADDDYYAGSYFSLAADPSPVDPTPAAESDPTPDDDGEPTEIESSPDVDAESESIQASVPELVAIALQCATRPIQARFANATNRRAFEGVLFRIDEPSEAAPAVGPGLPLLVSRAVAESVVNCCAGLPLDADRSFSKHCNEDIAGVIMSARIEGNDFIVTGYLYDWSRGEKVREIAANQEDLGMSMNATATGEVVDFNGQSVYQIQTLQLLGANILFAEKATYQKTRVLAAEAHTEDDSLDDGDVDAIAAASQTQPESAVALNQAYQALAALNLDLTRLVAQFPLST